MRLIPKFLLQLDFFALKAVIPNMGDSGGGESCQYTSSVKMWNSRFKYHHRLRDAAPDEMNIFIWPLQISILNFVKIQMTNYQIIS